MTNHSPTLAPHPAAGFADDSAPSPGRPVVLGEVLYDRFPDGQRRLGGAPFNVAWHLQAFGLAPLLVTRVGRDDAGDRVRDAMRGWGLDTSAVQRDDHAPTGVVEVSFEASQPSFEIVADQAYDRLEAGAALAAVTAIESSLLYHGTLIARSPQSAAALRTLRSRTSLPVFLDVNLRPPWWSADVVRRSLFGTRWAKLNRDELALLAPDSGPGEGAATEIESARTETDGAAFRRRFALDTVIVTLGADGAVFVDGGGAVRGVAPAAEPGGDSVGAGDAFSAVLITGIVRRWPREVTLRRALEFAALICSVQGAIVVDPAVYAAVVDRWAADSNGPASSAP